MRMLTLVMCEYATAGCLGTATLVEYFKLVGPAFRWIDRIETACSLLLFFFFLPPFYSCDIPSQEKR